MLNQDGVATDLQIRALGTKRRGMIWAENLPAIQIRRP